MYKHLISLIKINGSIGIDTFMNEVLFNPIRGYYHQSNPFGKKGDFITSPEISQVFGELIGVYLINIWKNNYYSQEINLVEMGAGKGTLMADFLRFVHKVPNFFSKVTINIIEISPKLREIQKENLSKFNINWWTDFSDFYSHNKKKPLFFIANELFDCFAINQFVKTCEGWVEKLVTLNNKDQLVFSLSNYNKIIEKTIVKLISQNNQLAVIEEIKEGAVFEYASGANSLMQELSVAIKNSGGIGIIIDYGYIENKFENSLQAVKNHQYHNILSDIGNTDITALVNFYALRNIAVKNNLGSSLITQKTFLEALEIRTRKEKLILGKNKEEQEKITLAIDRLINPKQMGDLFKCLIFWER